MTSAQLEKKIKRNSYGKPQSVIVTFPPGFSSIAIQEVKSILETLWFKQKYTSEITLTKNSIRIDQIHLFAVTELLMRSQCLTDIRLIICETKTASKFSFEKKCREIDWDLYLNPSMTLKIKVNSIASRVFHEGALKEILTHCIESYINDVVTGESVEETTTVYAELNKDKLQMSISLAGAPLYKRGYREILSKSAPLREDIAACCLQRAIQFAAQQNPHYSIDRLLIPFSGTGTFLFEYWLRQYQIAPVLIGREYALQAMPLFRAENFNYLLKKARENCLIENLSVDHVICIDSAESANTTLLNNEEIFRAAIDKNGLTWKETNTKQWLRKEKFQQTEVKSLFTNDLQHVFIPLNPPYGIRLAKNNDTVALYKQVARQIKSLSQIVNANKKNVSGFILCPNEDTWSAFCNTLTDAKIETYHMTQGGLDIRVAQFFY